MKKIIVFTVLVFSYIITYFFYYHQNTQNTITIGTKNFTEQKIIGYYLEALIEDNTEYEVNVLPGIGETSFLNNALISQDIDIYVDYTSTAFQTILKKDPLGNTREEINEITFKEYDEKFDLNFISLLGFDNSNTIICTKFCEENNITKLSQLKEYENIRIGAIGEFFTREDELKLLNREYGVHDTKNIVMDHGLVYTALDNNDIDLAHAYTTDGQLATGNYVILEDDLNKMPKYDAAVIIRNDMLKNDPQLAALLESTNNTFSNETMTKLNYQVDIEKQKPFDAANQHYNSVKNK